MRRVGLIFSLLVLAAILLFTIQNTDSVELNFLGWSAQMSLAFPVLASYLLGGLTARFVWRLLNAPRRAKKAAKRAEKDARAKIHKEELAQAQNQVRRGKES